MADHLAHEISRSRFRLQLRAQFAGAFTIGPGSFYDLYVYKGLFLQPNLRWPTVAGSLDAGRALTASDGSTYRPERHDLLPFVNVDLGWTFDGS
jgi:hypothetical protein